MSEVVCAWCHKVIRRLADRRIGISHGICPECKTKYFPDINSQVR